MTVMSDILDPDALARHVANGTVRATPAPELGLTVYKYSPMVPAMRLWDQVTLTCRGIIFDDDGRLVARPFSKFFNLSEHADGEIDINATGLVMDKIDGSLGIGFHRDGAWHVSTQGSARSEHAVFATGLMRAAYADTRVVDGWTPLFEIIAPQFRIVADYGDTEDLILLGAVADDGRWIGPDAARELFGFTGPVAPSWRGSIRDALATPDPGDLSEGFVVAPDTGPMVKIKFPSYLAAHRARFQITPRSVFRALRDGTDAEVRALLPDEFYADFDAVAAPLRARFAEVEEEAAAWSARVPEGDRGHRARWVTAHVPPRLRSVVMRRAVAGDDATDAIWRIVGEGL